jgi:hypothetical protein
MLMKLIVLCYVVYMSPEIRAAETNKLNHSVTLSGLKGGETLLHCQSDIYKGKTFSLM